MIRRVGESLGRVVLDGIGRAASRVQERRSLPVDLLESDDAYLAVFDAPGARAGDVDVRFDQNSLSVRVDRLRDDHAEYEMRFPGRGQTLEGSVTLPDDAAVEADGAEATLTGTGALEVLIPKTEADEAVTASDPVSVDDGAGDGASADA